MIHFEVYRGSSLAQLALDSPLLTAMPTTLPYVDDQTPDFTRFHYRIDVVADVVGKGADRRRSHLFERRRRAAAPRDQRDRTRRRRPEGRRTGRDLRTCRRSRRISLAIG